MLQATRRQSAFSTWLRTGIWPDADPEVEVKYNHWHDERDGRFTSAQTGRHDGSWQGGGFTGGGGGNFGGGGASGSWGAGRRARGESGSPRAPTHRVGPRAHVPARGLGSAVARHARSHTDATDVSPPLHFEMRNGYAFGIDEQGRTKTVSGTITLASTSRRSRSAQAGAGGDDRRTSDDGGHYIAARFNGPTDAFNHFAQDANFNRGAYRAIEGTWASETKAGKRVSVTILPAYHGRSKRPSSLRISYIIGDKTSYRTVYNERHGGYHGR